MAERAGAVVLGPGLGRDEGAVEFARGVARRVEAPLLVDADGLNAHAGRLELFREREAPTVLTPHEGELGRLLERGSDEVARHRLACAREAAERSGAVVLLKGDDTIVALPGGEVGGEPGRHAGARHGGHRRRALRADRRAAREGARGLRGGLPGRAGPRARRRAPRRTATARTT